MALAPSSRPLCVNDNVTFHNYVIYDVTRCNLKTEKFRFNLKTEKFRFWEGTNISGGDEHFERGRTFREGTDISGGDGHSGGTDRLTQLRSLLLGYDIHVCACCLNAWALVLKRLKRQTFTLVQHENEW